MDMELPLGFHYYWTFKVIFLNQSKNYADVADMSILILALFLFFFFPMNKFKYLRTAICYLAVWTWGREQSVCMDILPGRGYVLL